MICWSLGTQYQKSTKWEKLWMSVIAWHQGHLEYYLGVQATQPDANTLMLHQAGYINKIFDSFHMSECTPVSTPLPLNLNLSRLDCPDEVDSKLQAEYRAIVGSLMYLYQWTWFGIYCSFLIKTSTQAWCQAYASSQANSKVFERN